MYGVKGFMDVIKETAIFSDPNIYKGDIRVFVNEKECDYRVIQNDGDIYIIVNDR